MEQSSINVFERISAEYYNLTTAEKKAADYVLSHQRNCLLYTSDAADE